MYTLDKLNVIKISNNYVKPIRYIAITGGTLKSCQKMKLLLKHTSCYCVVAFYKNINDLEQKEVFYLPDFVLIDINSLRSMASVNKKIERLEETIPGVKVVLYYNTLIRCSLFEKRNSQYPVLHAWDSEETQLATIEQVLQFKECIV
ncbi:MAG: hypothetical protein WDM90_23450 [Ferruginibacter sp.]